MKNWIDKRTTRSAKRLVVVAALLGILGVVGSIALAKNETGLPAPTITSSPVNPTNQSSASFTYTDSAAITKFQCSLDGSAFTDCGTTRPSSKTYPGLASTSHTFQVKAVSGTTQSNPTSYTWTVDTTPPSITITFPTNNGVYSATAWNNGCANGAGICGSASDPSGVAAGLVSIQQQSSGKWWNGSAFNSNSEVFNTAKATGSATSYTGRYQLALPSDGLYTVHVRATDKAGNTTPAGSQVARSFRIKATKPPKPVFDATPPDPNNTATSTFAWHDAEAGVTYECSKENGSFQPCSSPLTYQVATTNDGQHQFAVRAIDAVGNVSEAASYKWKVSAGSPSQFVIHGSVSGLMIGVAKSVPLTIDNPNSVPIFISQLTFSVSTNAGSGTCSASNFAVTPWNANPPSAPELQVPANAVGFPVPVADQPKLTLTNLPSNQDNCKSKTFSLTFSGSSHS